MSPRAPGYPKPIKRYSELSLEEKIYIYERLIKSYTNEFNFTPFICTNMYYAGVGCQAWELVEDAKKYKLDGMINSHRINQAEYTKGRDVATQLWSPYFITPRLDFMKTMLLKLKEERDDT